MSSKSKKKSPKTPLSKLQSSQQENPPSSPSPQSSSSHFSEIDFHNTLEEASRKFPSFVTKSSLIAQLSEFDSSSQQKGCKIWLSEASMLASSISPASLVSVSLASVDQYSTSGFPLSSLPTECSEHFGVDWNGSLDDKLGNYFILATAFPSSKLVKNGVRISHNLLYSLGCPLVGRIVFVQPIQGGSLTRLVHGNGKLHGSPVDHSSVYYCKELSIRLLPFKKKLASSMDASSPSRNCTDKTPNLYESGNPSSPRTPSLERSRQSSPSPSKSLLASEDAASNLNGIKRSYCDAVEMKEILGDKDAKKLLQRTAVSWFCSRALLCGNLVTIPVLSRLCLCEVVGLKSFSSDSTGRDPIQTSLVHGSDEAFIIDRSTKVKIGCQSIVPTETQEERISTSGEMESKNVNIKTGDEVMKLGGLCKEYALLRDIISASMKNSLSSLGLRTTKGVLLHGPPGTGKTSLAQLCTQDAGVNLFKVNGAEIVSQYHGESEQGLHDVFKSASEAAPSVVFIDELDAIAPARKEGGEELSQRMVATLLNLMDGISRTNGLFVIAATNRLECIEPALRRPGRLDREIEIGVPSPDQRLDILTTLLDEMEHSLSLAQVQQLAVVTHGFVGADLAALSNEAAMVCLRRFTQSNNFICDLNFKSSTNDGSDVVTEGCCYARNHSESFVEDHEASSCSEYLELADSSTSVQYPSSGETMVTLNNEKVALGSSGFSSTTDYMLKITFEDFERARMKIRPSAMREVILEIPRVKWEDVGGQEEVKAQLMEAVEWPQKHQDAFERIGTRPPTGVLLFGPPGCSKTLMARAVASEAGLNFLAVKGPELFSKWVGESEKAVRSLFAKARANAPSVIFFDEIDSLAVIRGKESDGVSVADRVMSQLLVELDGLHGRVNVTVIAATNRPDKIDPALLRPGRFDRLLYVGPPSETDRVDVFHVHLRKMPCGSDVDVSELAHLTEGCTGADISLICREAAISAIEENLNCSEIKMEHLKTAILRVHPSEIQPYQELSDKFQRLVHSKSPSEACEHQLNRPKELSSCRNPVKWIQQLALW
ncbi:calmodulin-interacting protein 111 isoform X1 [Spinacia oleracea]|uniref:Calmodulin-interacting protein 111 isoform X1 n=1 Tax=Spinacia oleracea TaxID=3562 RepID=A0A9R0J9M6_SPIOL|nr:calmodulin-interacting protein 111 isoform X1 [Spinacia oleracea]